MCPVMSWLLCLCLWVSVTAIQLCQATFYDTIQQHHGTRPGRTTIHMIAIVTVRDWKKHTHRTLSHTQHQHINTLRKRMQGNASGAKVNLQYHSGILAIAFTASAPRELFQEELWVTAAAERGVIHLLEK
ncbi:hypothetical protein L3Q82_015927 [Scortum barcoo]|uniref:Uncharacterized protein n=1 Tax=Scortum barcoo TaxID=214431 RepID=A0ACB8VPG0_9TELE|nr:hypothetical protein L3Q82_015927 [Scortum barcoo]